MTATPKVYFTLYTLYPSLQISKHYYIHMMEYYSPSKNKGILPYATMFELGRLHAKGSKPDTEGQILHDST